MDTHSLTVRLQRTTTETAYIDVPITPDVILEQPDGSVRLDLMRLVRRAVELGGGPDVRWEVEERTVQPHPVQSEPPPADGVGDSSPEPA